MLSKIRRMHTRLYSRNKLFKNKKEIFEQKQFNVVKFQLARWNGVRICVELLAIQGQKNLYQFY